MGSDDWPDWLPGDWTINIKKVDERKVKAYVDPEGHRCYSMPQVLNYLRKKNKSASNEKTENADDPAIDLSVEPNADEVPESSPGGHPAKLTPRSSRRKTNFRDLSEDVLAGDDSSFEPSPRSRDSRGRKSIDASWLPEGWTVEVKTRQGGSSSGMKYKLYTDPSGHKFFSKPQVLAYLNKTDNSAGGQGAVFTEPISATPISAWQEKPDNSELDEATEAGNKTPRKKASARLSSRLSSAHEVISRTPAEGLPAGWIKELRLRKRGLHKTDPFYIHPSVEYAFFSKKDALRYLESGDVASCAIKPLKRDINSDATLDVNLTSPPDQSNGTGASKDLTNGSVDDSGEPNAKPARSITGGSFTTPPTTKGEGSSWLPDGWEVEVRFKSSGAKFKIYKDPTGRRFNSKPQVLSFLGMASSSNSKKRKEDKSSDVATDASPNSTPGSRPKRGRKKAKIENDDCQEIITTSAAEGLPPGWIKEIRTKIYATHKRNDPFYTDPVSGYIFRSKLDAMRFLETGDVNLCAIRPKVKDKDGNEVLVYTSDVKKPAAGKEGDEANETSDPKPAENTNRRASARVTKQSTPPGRSSKRQKGKNVETGEGNGEKQATGVGKGEGNGEKQTTGVNLEKQPDEEGNLTFEIPDDDNWTDHCIDFAVKTLTNEIMFNGQPAAAGDGGGGGGFPEENVGPKETTPTKVN